MEAIFFVASSLLALPRDPHCDLVSAWVAVAYWNWELEPMLED